MNEANSATWYYDAIIKKKKVLKREENEDFPERITFWLEILRRVVIVTSKPENINFILNNASHKKVALLSKTIRHRNNSVEYIFFMNESIFLIEKKFVCLKISLIRKR